MDCLLLVETVDFDIKIVPNPSLYAKVTAKSVRCSTAWPDHPDRGPDHPAEGRKIEPNNKQQKLKVEAG